MSWVDQIHTHLYGIADRQTECPHTVPAHVTGNGARHFDRRVFEPHVVGDEYVSRTDADRSRSRMRMLRSEVGRESGPGIATNVRELALVGIGRSVHENRHIEFGTHPLGEIVTCAAGVMDRGTSEWNERNDVHYPESGMHAVVNVETQCLETSSGEIADGCLAHKSEDTAMVMAIGMTIEPIFPADLVEVHQPFEITSFAHVDDAFEHDPTLPVPVPRPVVA